jgi:hypothetical protein
MSYLPPRKVEGTVFPQAMGTDLANMVAQIEERWRRSYPKIQYSSLSKVVTPVAKMTDLTGAAGTTKFDPLWGESVPDRPTWEQPHHNPASVAASPEKYLAPQPLYMRFERMYRENQLKKFGFDRLRNGVSTFPTSMLDERGITVGQGDRFTWNDETFEVIQWSPDGYWMNTNVFLYVVCSVQHARFGS